MKTTGGILILAEALGKLPHPVAYELIGKAREISGGGAVSCLVLGEEDLALGELCLRGCDTVYHMVHPCFSHPEEQLFKANILPFVRELNPSVILTGATNFGRSLAPRLAAALGTGLTADCTQLRLDEAGALIQIRPAFSDHILAHIKTGAQPQMATIRYKEFPEAERDEGRPVRIERINPTATANRKSTVLEVLQHEAVDITGADVVVAGGRGVRRKEDLALLRELATLLGGELGVSRALVDAGMADSAVQIGYSGNRVKPLLYVACGISGAPQHIAGMKEAQTVVAINSDPSAPIFGVCDYGMVGDLYEVLPRLIRDLKETAQA